MEDLAQLDVLVGEWDTEMTHPMLAETARGRTVFEWLPGRKFLIWRTENPPDTIPSSISLIGGEDDGSAGWPMHYFDSRGVSRVYRIGFEDGVWTMWRDHPGFSQRARGAIEERGCRIDWRSELQREDGEWKPDLEVTYRRRTPPR